jgi:alanyl aminopeptidase
MIRDLTPMKTISRSRLFLGALVLGAGWSSVATAATDRLGHDVLPAFEAVRLDVDATRADYSGSVEIALKVAETTDRFRLHARDMEIRSLTVAGASGEIPTRREKVGDDQLLVRAEAPLAPGDYTLVIAFAAPFNTKAVALYRVEQDGQSYAFTQFEAADARGAFPCFDEPGFKIPWQLTVEVPKAHLAVSNTPVESDTAEGDRHRVVFRRTEPLPSYLIALATGPLETVDVAGLGVPGRVVTPKGQAGLAAAAVEMAPPLLKALERYFGQPYPYAKLDLVAVPEFWPGAMENAGAITFADRILLLDPSSTSLAQRRILAKVMAHEMAHMWFGDLVTMEWWDDLWLNESFADWMGDKVTNEVFPQFRLDLQVTSDAQRVMIGDARPTAEAIRRPVATAEDLLQGVQVEYDKGKAVLGMFEAWISPEVFREGVLAYLAGHAWGSATSADLWKALDEASSGQVGAALATFVDQPGLPLVEVQPLAGGRVRLAQRRYAALGVRLPPETWSIPVALKYAAGGGVKTRVVLLDREETVVDLGTTPAWIDPNAGARGYYRWRVPDERLSRLTTDAPSLLTDAERMDLVGNLSALLDAGIVDGGRLLQSLGRLAEDPEPMVVASVLDPLDGVKRAFVSPSLEDDFARYLRRTLRPALDRIGLVPREGESDTTALVRPRLLLWLGDDGGDAGVRRFAERQAEAYLENPASVPSSIASACLDLATMNADEARFDLLRHRFEAAPAPSDRERYLQALGWVRDPGLLDRALDYSFSGPLRANELFVIPRGVAGTLTGRERAYRWMTVNYARLAKRLPPEFMGFMPFFASGCSAGRLAAARAFFAQPDHQTRGTGPSLGSVAAQVEECLALRAREGQTVQQFLQTATP